FARVAQDSGLAAYGELEDVPESERLTAALARTQQRFLATPEQERVYPPADAIRELGRLTGTFCAVSMQLIDVDLLRTLPTRAPRRARRRSRPTANIESTPGASACCCT